MESIYHLAEDFIRDGGGMVKRDDRGQLGILFKDEREFIPFIDLGYNSEMGLYRLSLFPDVENQSYKPRIEETFFSSGRFLEGEDDYPYLAILSTDLADGWIIGSWEHVEKVYHVLGRLLRTQQADEEIAEFDERLGDRWLDVKEASDRFGVSAATIRRVCSKGKIEGATKKNGTWRFPEARFKGWKYRHYQPKKGRGSSR